MGGNDQTFLKQAFQHDSSGTSTTTTTGYKQLKPSDETAIVNDVEEDGFSPSRNISSPSLATISATVGNSPVGTNPFKGANHSYRSQHHQYFPSGTNIHHGGHYATNISSGSPLNLSAPKKSFDLSSRQLSQQQHHHHHYQHQQNSSYQHQPSPTNESQFMQLISTPKTSSRNPLRTTTICSSWECNGIRELLSSLALMCVLSILTAFLALFFLQRSGPVTAQWIDDHHGSPGSITTITESNHSRTHIPKASSLTTPFNQRLVTNVREYQRVFQISVCLSTLTIALDLCCLFVCCIQFLSIVKLIKTPFGKRRSFEFIKKTSHIRILAIGAYLVSIPIFFTGVILYTFVNFDEIPALITSVIIGIGIIFCGVASVQNVYLWQWEKTKASQDMRQSQQAAMSTITNGQHHMTTGSIIHNGSHYPLELSTLV